MYYYIIENYVGYWGITRKYFKSEREGTKKKKMIKNFIFGGKGGDSVL